MRKYIIFFAAFFTMLTAGAASGHNEGNPGVSDIQHPQGGVIEYEGTIGQYPVEFTFMNLHMGNGLEFYYQYKTIKVNNGEPIELVYQKSKGEYDVYHEYINGKHTGTFTIIRTNTTIKGTFRNSKGKTYKVNAHMVRSNYAEE